MWKVERGEGKERTHAEKDEKELLFCLTSTQASCDLQIQLRENKVCLILSVGVGVCLCVCSVKGIKISLITALGSLCAATGT